MSLPSTREELVGKRFLCVRSGSGNKLKIPKVSDWPWKSGLIRCATHLNQKDPDLQVELIYYYYLFEVQLEYKGPTVIPLA